MISESVRRFLATFCWDEYYFPMDGPFQNYTYFPPATLREVRACWERTADLIRAGRAPRDIGLYIHWPFCPSRCSFCFCSMRVPRSRSETAAYLAMLEREMEAFRGVFRGLGFTSLWVGGGTPTFMSEAELDRLLARAQEAFPLEPGAEVYVEASAATLTKGKVEVLLRRGVNRVTLGLQSFDGQVLARVDRRGQDRGAAERAFDLVSGRGMVVDVDLMAGLPGQTRESFIRDLAWVMRRRPDVLHLFAFDPRRQTLLAAGGYAHSPGQRRELRILIETADRALLAAGYRMSRLDPETLEPDCPEERQDSAVRRLGASVLGLGASAISHAFGTAWYCHPLSGSPRPGGARPAGGLPPFRLMRSGLDEEMRGWVLRQLALFGMISLRGFHERFGTALAKVPGLGAAVRGLEAAGGLRRDGPRLFCAGRDPVERHVGLKRLYSPRVVRAIMNKHAAGYRDFLAQDARGGRWAGVVREKMDFRNLFRVYFKGAAA
ncbi:MAG: radical SAM protein [Elusimicrobia bacterium]|nr:radical SAM protein [Elusimicrobiota bacterium]